VNTAGSEKNAPKLIALGRTHEVILQGDYSARDGFHLENVDNVLIRGFTIHDFGEKATTATEWGVGNLIYLENAHYNTIEQNQFVNPDRAAVMLVDSSNNVVRRSAACEDDANLAACGNKLAGIMIAGAGPGNMACPRRTADRHHGRGRRQRDFRRRGSPAAPVADDARAHPGGDQGE